MNFSGFWLSDSVGFPTRYSSLLYVHRIISACEVNFCVRERNFHKRELQKIHFQILYKFGYREIKKKEIINLRFVHVRTIFRGILAPVASVFTYERPLYHMPRMVIFTNYLMLFLKRGIFNFIYLHVMLAAVNINPK